MISYYYEEGTKRTLQNKSRKGDLWLSGGHGPVVRVVLGAGEARASESRNPATCFLGGGTWVAGTGDAFNWH